MSEDNIKDALNLLKRECNKIPHGIVLNSFTKDQLWTIAVIKDKTANTNNLYGIPFIVDYRINAKTEIFYTQQSWLDKQREIEESRNVVVRWQNEK